jgi:hypothetical protein
VHSLSKAPPTERRTSKVDALEPSGETGAPDWHGETVINSACWCGLAAPPSSVQCDPSPWYVLHFDRVRIITSFH